MNMEIRRGSTFPDRIVVRCLNDEQDVSTMAYE